MYVGFILVIINLKLVKGFVYFLENLLKWNNVVDSGVYNGGGIVEGLYVVIVKVGFGKVVFIGDFFFVEDVMLKYVCEDFG